MSYWGKNCDLKWLNAKEIGEKIEKKVNKSRYMDDFDAADILRYINDLEDKIIKENEENLYKNSD